MSTTTEQATQDTMHGTELADVLAADDEQQSRVYGELLAALQANVAADAVKLWRQLARDIEAHIHLEESRILPELFGASRVEVEALRREHGEIRAQLRDLAERWERIELEVELRAAVDVTGLLDAVRALGERLQHHASREHALLFPWLRARTHPL